MGRGSGRRGDPADAAGILRTLDPERESLVTFVGKLIVSKGVDLLLAAWPLVCARAPDARLCVVGFGTYREGLGLLADALGRGDLEAAREIAARGRELEGGPAGELPYLARFLDGLEGDLRERYLASAPRAMERAHFVGGLEHEDLPAVLAAASAQVVPSTFPEAFGMVAIEAAACGALPLVAAHSGLADVADSLGSAVEEGVRPLLSFEPGPHAVGQIAAKLLAWLGLERAVRERAAAALARRAGELYGWDRVAEGVIAAAQGRLAELSDPGAPEWGKAAGPRDSLRAP